MMIKTFEDLRSELEKTKGVMLLGHVAEEVYRAHEALSQSELKVVADKSPAHLRHYRRTQKPQTDSQRLGTAIHTAILEPEMFEERYMRAPQCDRRKKEGREKWSEVQTQSKELQKKVLVGEEYEAPLAIRSALMSNPEVSCLFRDGVPERSCFGHVFGVHGKARPDYYIPGRHEIIDLKSTRSASLKEFERDLRKFRYHWQACWYSDLITAITGETPTYRIVAVETSAPFCSAVFTIKFDLMAIARVEIQETVDVIRRCQETGDWHGYRPSEIGASPAEWSAYKKAIRE